MLMFLWFSWCSVGTVLSVVVVNNYFFCGLNMVYNKVHFYLDFYWEFYNILADEPLWTVASCSLLILSEL